MSSPESTSSSSSYVSNQEIARHNRRHRDDPHPPRRSAEVSRDSPSQRPLPELPLPRLPASHPDSAPASSHSGQMLAAILRDRPLPLPLSSAEQTAEERRRSIIAIDRKRRLTNPASYEETMRKTNSGRWNDRRASNDSYRIEGPSSPHRHASSDTILNRPLPEVVDFTGSSPPTPESQTPRTPRPSRTSSDSARRYVVPRWQPDAEVNECPICNRPFTWMFRRHHCRKCGRVVCNDCSPHRITIPRQFIVHPPGPDMYASLTDPVNRRESIGSSEDELYGDSGSPHRRNHPFQLEGGEKVRLCNPCVPDPQPDPLPNYPPLIPDQSSRGASWNADARQVSGTGPPLNTETRPRAFSARVGHPPSLGSSPYLHQYHRSMGAQPANTNADPRGEGLTLFGSYRGQSSPSRYRMHIPRTPLNPPLFTGHSSTDYPPQGSRATYNHSRPSFSESRQARDEPSGARQPSNRSYPRPLHELTYSPAVHRPRINENDICPVCRRALPPRGPDGDETARETHIMDCINSRDPSLHAEASNAAAAVRLGGAGSEAGSSSQYPHHQRLNMLAFTATEKDCVSQEDGQVQECSICMVEYDVGDELVRLECLCKFHQTCIMEWVERKAECPVHKLIG